MTEPRLLCSEPGCEKPVRRRGLCCAHYDALRSRPDFAALAHPKLCKQPDCGLAVEAHGLCRMHYARYRRARAKRGKKCARYGCTNLATCRGLCHRHYLQLRASPGFRKFVPLPKRVCEVPACTAKPHAKGLCRKHYRQRRREAARAVAERERAARAAAASRRAEGYGGADVRLDVWMERQLAAIRRSGTGPGTAFGSRFG